MKIYELERKLKEEEHQRRLIQAKANQVARLKTVIFAQYL